MATYNGMLRDNSTFTEFTITPAFATSFTFGTDASVTVTVTPNSGYEITEAKIFYGGMEETSMQLQSDNTWTYEITDADLSSMKHSGNNYIADNGCYEVSFGLVYEYKVRIPFKSSRG